MHGYIGFSKTRVRMSRFSIGEEKYSRGRVFKHTKKVSGKRKSIKVRLATYKHDTDLAIEHICSFV